MISLLIPTINRSDFIIKYLISLNENKFQGQVLIGDSSDRKHFELTKTYIEKKNFDFEVRQYAFPGMYPHPCIQQMLDDVNNPFCMFICDDDVLIVETLNKCVDFLQKNPDYSGVGGVAIGCLINQNDLNKVDSTYLYKVDEYLKDTAMKRVSDILENYTVINYSLARTDEFKKRWPSDTMNYDKAIGTEILPTIILAAQGKVKMLEDLFVVRQIHKRRIILPDLIDNIIQKHWSGSTNFAIDYLSKIVAQTDGIPFDDVYPQVRDYWKKYLYNCFHVDIKKRKSSKTNYRSLLKKIPFLLGIYRKVSIFGIQIKSNQNYVHLDALIKPTSRYHKHFMQVYDVIIRNTTPSEYSELRTMSTVL